ncbi:phosphoribosylaminoimidazolesuccinocarboxamide synthase [Prosthecobacter sp. SYSU 5D2]|uniref:phosphoribosylaminoimidazolesuccinocarboxamide synthase n=1 Tax=Prosthecobacter sp. SYSU 5D2 TaxID=3134134 RepID=UPI0031FE4D6A
MSYPAPAPARLDLSQLGEPVYLGSVQHLYAVPDHPSYIVCQTTPAGSVFDVGSIFSIAGNDLNRAIFRHAMYSRLTQPATWRRVQDALLRTDGLGVTWRDQLMDGPLQTMLEGGARTHHVGMLDGDTGEVIAQGMPATPSCYNIVRRFPVMKPPQRNVMGNFVFDYAQFHQSDTYVIPLEYIVRFGVTSGSSVLRKYEALSEKERRAFEQELGLTGPMQAWQMLDRPIYDLTSKYEPEDRAVSKQEALLMSGLSAQHFTDTIKMALLGAWAVRDMLEEIGLQLWDLKWEFAVDRETLLFVDTIDADSFRATSTVPVDGRNLIIHYNKQAMRDYYRLVCADWYAGINAAKAEAQKTGTAFKQVLADGQAAGLYPATPEVDAAFLDLQATKTALIKDHVLGAKDAASIRSGLVETGLAEAEFYRSKGLLDELLKLNAV